MDEPKRDKAEAKDFATNPTVPCMIAWPIRAGNDGLAEDAVLTAVWRDGMIQSVSLHVAAPGASWP